MVRKFRLQKEKNWKKVLFFVVKVAPDQVNFPRSPKALKRSCFGQTFCAAIKVLKKQAKPFEFRNYRLHSFNRLFGTLQHVHWVVKISCFSKILDIQIKCLCPANQDIATKSLVPKLFAQIYVKCRNTKTKLSEFWFWKDFHSRQIWCSVWCLVDYCNSFAFFLSRDPIQVICFNANV